MLFFGHDPNRWLADEDEKEKESFDHVRASNDTKCQLKTKKKICYNTLANRGPNSKFVLKGIFNQYLGMLNKIGQTQIMNCKSGLKCVNSNTQILQYLTAI